MPGEKQETVLMGVRYRMVPLGFLTGRQVAIRVMPAFLAAMSDVVATVDPSKGLEGLGLRDLGGLLGGAGKVLTTLGEQDIGFMTDKLAEQTMVLHETGPKTKP